MKTFVIFKKSWEKRQHKKWPLKERGGGKYTEKYFVGFHSYKKEIFFYKKVIRVTTSMKENPITPRTGVKITGDCNAHSGSSVKMFPQLETSCN